MCAIFGLINFREKGIDLLKIIEVSNALKHRGPDDEGFLCYNVENDTVDIFSGIDTPLNVKNQNFSYSPKKDLMSLNDLKSCDVFFLHRRLSIIDLSPLGHQPMCDESCSYWIIYNGEIYNYLELRDYLKKKGYLFISKSDVEVILKAYEEWGEDCVNHFNGMWAFAILDRKKKRIFCSRDISGVKPFYYMLFNSSFIFASELKAFKIFKKLNINEKIVWDYLVLKRSTHTEETFYEEVKELEPATNITISLDGYVRLKRYWYIDNFGNDKCNFYDFEQEKNKLFNQIKEGIKIRLRSDVPIGSCLSGGIDSSTIVALSNILLSEGKDLNENILISKQKTFTAAYEDDKIDETKYVEILRKRYSFDTYFVCPNKEEFIKDVLKLVEIQEEPFGSTSVYAQYRVMKRAKEIGVKVLLDGQGADELFGGYLNYENNYLFECLKKEGFFTFLKELYLNSKIDGEIPFFLKFISLQKEILKAYFLEEVIELLKAFKMGIYFLNKDFYHTYKERFEREINKVQESLFSLNKKLIYDFTGSQLRTLLRYEDRNSMWFSIETRTPFADDKVLVESVFNLPYNFKIRNGWKKFILRKTVEEILPYEICWRREKIGFITPEKEWTKNLFGFFGLSKSLYLDNKKILKRKGNIDWRFLNIALWEQLN